MKTSIKIMSLLACVSVGFMTIGCDKDNYDAPSRMLTGHVTYNGQAVGVNGSNQSIQLQLWEDNMELSEPMPVFVKQDGSFSALLFDGSYSLVAKDNNGPWVNNQDTIRIQINGNLNIDYPITPYYTIENEAYILEDNKLKASFDLKEITAGKTLKAVSLIINSTQFVDLKSSINEVSGAKQAGHIEISTDLTKLMEKEDFLFCRIAVQINGIEEAIYSNSIKKLK